MPSSGAGVAAEAAAAGRDVPGDDARAETRASSSLEQDQLFMHSGTMHLFAINGLHIGIVAVAVHALAPAGAVSAMAAGGKARRLLIPRLDVDTTGASPSAVRAWLLVAACESGAGAAAAGQWHRGAGGGGAGGAAHRADGALQREFSDELRRRAGDSVFRAATRRAAGGSDGRPGPICRKQRGCGGSGGWRGAYAGFGRVLGIGLAAWLVGAVTGVGIL